MWKLSVQGVDIRLLLAVEFINRERGA